MDNLTGKTRYRPSFFGKLILQVEYVEINTYTTCWQTCETEKVVSSYWRDASIKDFTISKE